MLKVIISKSLKAVCFCVFIFSTCFATQTKLLAEGNSEQSALTNRYVFQPAQSTIIQTGGISSVNYTFNVSGQFVLNIDSETSTASFIKVDANAIEVSPGHHILDPNKVFTMTSLSGVVLNDTTIEFTGKDSLDSNIYLTATLLDASLHLVGNTTPPQGSADYFIFNIDAVAKKKYSGGTGEPNNPYQIGTPDDLIALGNTPEEYNNHFILIADINLADHAFNKAVIAWDTDPKDPNRAFQGHSFTGVFNGNDYTISHLTIWGKDYTGLFGLLAGEVKNLGLVGINIFALGNYVGGLVGNNNGTIIHCYSTGTISIQDYVGGLVGTNCGSLIQSCSFCTVSGRFCIGGLAGANLYGGIITQCYSSGSAKGYDDIGGLVGASSSVGNIDKCYSTCKVIGDIYGTGGLVGGGFYSRVLPPDIPPVNSCFWNIQASGTSNGIGNIDPDPNGVIGKTTIEMYDPNTFLDAGWDFIGETINGPNDIWWILEGKDYPRLWWQLPADDFNDCNAAPLWFPYEVAPELAHLEEVNGRLEVNTAGAMDDIDAIYAPYNWGLDANKPFEVQVNFHFSKTGTGDGRINLGIVPSMDPSAMKWAEFEAGTFDENPFYLYEIRDGEWVEEQTCQRYFNDGTLYISYDPNSDELYFSNIGYGKKYAFWTVSGLIRGSWQTDSIYIILSGGSEDGMALTGEDAWLDNFKVHKGTIWQ